MEELEEIIGRNAEPSLPPQPPPAAPPSPLDTEADEDDLEGGGPSSVEAQADPNDLSFDLDLDLPIPSYPLVSPQPSTSNDIFNEDHVHVGDVRAQLGCKP